MDIKILILDALKAYGVGRRLLEDQLFAKDKPPLRLGIYDEDDESLCHEVVKSTCHVLGCTFTTDSLLDFENHYNTAHRYTCNECKKVLPSPHLLDLHIQEVHDSFFAVVAVKKPSYCCYIEECKEKFINAEERLDHCVTIHRIPKDYRFDQKPRVQKTTVKKKNAKSHDTPMETEHERKTVNYKSQFSFSNSKQKAFTSYTGKKFTCRNREKTTKDVDMDVMVEALRESLPQ